MAKKRTKSKAPASRKRTAPRKPTTRDAKVTKSASSKKKAGARRAAKARLRRARPLRAVKAALALGEDVEPLFDLVCSIEDVLATGLTFAICEERARAHNKAMPGHDAAPSPEQT